MSEGTSGERRSLLAGIVDEILPPSADGSLPGAAEIGVGDYVEQTFQQQPPLAPLLDHGLEAVRRLAASRNPGGFGALPRAERAALLREVEAREPGFFGALVMFTYLGYYSSRTVALRLGLQTPPQPKGYELEPGDPGLLDPVRQRPPLYRTS